MKRSVARGLAVPLVALVGCAAPALSVPALAPPPAAPASSASSAGGAGKSAGEPPSEPGGRYCFDPARDVRRHATTSRKLAVVRSEHENLVTIYDATPAMTEDKTAIAVTIGDTEAELAGLELSRADGHESDALAHYLDASKGKGPTAFEAKYRVALTYECQANYKDARKLLFDIVSNAPQSRLVPYAYFAFGEMFAKEAATDPTKLMLAMQSFERAASFPSPISALTKARLGEMQARLSTSP